MRSRTARASTALTLAVLAAVLSSPTALAGSPYQPEQGSEIGRLLGSLVSGDNPLITEVESTDAFSPIGGPAEDPTGRATLTHTFHTTANLGEFSRPGDLNFDGVNDIPTDGFRLGESDGAPVVDPLTDLLEIDLGTFAPTFGSPTSRLFGDIDIDSPDVQDFNGTPIRLLGDMNWQVPSLDVVDIWGGRFETPLTVELTCGPDLFEFGKAFSLPDGSRWNAIPGVADNDLFDGASNAIVNRCRDGFWYVDALSNIGSQFQSYDTNTFSIIWPEGWVSFTDRRETSAIQDYRMFAFQTPLVGGYQQSNTYATTEPAYPGMRAPVGTYLVGTPFNTDYGPFPLQLDFTLDSGADSACPPSWSGIFELYADMADRPGSYDAALYQFASGQTSLGTLVWDDNDLLDLMAEGSGEGYSDGFDIRGSGPSNYTYRLDGFECPYGLEYSDGWLDAQDSLRTAEIALGVRSDGSEPEDTGDTGAGGPDTGQQEPDATSTTDSSSAGDDSGGGGIPWSKVSIGTGLLLLLTGYGITRTRQRSGDSTTTTDDPPPTPAPTAAPPTTAGPTTAGTTAPVATGPCDRLRRLHAAAQADAEAKRTAATTARRAADTAAETARTTESEAETADSAAQEAERNRRAAERNRDRPPAGEEDSWIEDSETGERITGRDLRLRREAAAEALDDYRENPSQESAEQTEQDWEDLDAPGSRAGRRDADDTDQATRQQRLDDATEAETKADQAKTNADRARDEADQAARDAQADAVKAEGEADAAEARAAALKRQLEECLGLSSGPGTRWGGPMGMGTDSDGGCFPEGNVERVVIDTFDRVVKVNYWVTVRPTSAARDDARQIAGELRWWRDMFATTSSAINVAGAVSGLVTRTAGDAVETAVSGGSVVAGEELGIDIPTTIYQVPVVALEGAAAASAAIIDAFGGWIELNHVEWVAEWGYQVRDCKLAWVEIWKCENGVKKCAERVLEVNIGAPTLTGVVNTETYHPRERWQSRVDGLTRTHATRVQRDAQSLTDFMQKHKVGPCG